MCFFFLQKAFYKLRPKDVWGVGEIVHEPRVEGRIYNHNFIKNKKKCNNGKGVETSPRKMEKVIVILLISFYNANEHEVCVYIVHTSGASSLLRRPKDIQHGVIFMAYMWLKAIILIYN